MILYFSATGNTQYAAERIAETTGDHTVSVRECMKTGQREFTLEQGENFGIVMPTYFQGVPEFLRTFLESVRLCGDPSEHYAYAVSTCGVSYGNSGSEAVKAAEKAGIHLDATFRIRMVDNWNPYFDMTDQEYVRSAEKTAEQDLQEVCGQIAAKKRGVYLEDSFDRQKEEELAASYDESRKTDLFQVGSSCIGCGACAGQCPVQAIELKNGKPVWVKDACLLCLGCVHKCPKNAIAYTDATIDHGQYINPHVREIR